jgi:cobalt-zinc-cadmium efflux system protein
MSLTHTHDHSHGHHHAGIAQESMRNIAVAFGLNFAFACIELIGGWWTQSIAIQADAIHDFGDSLVLAAALGLQFWSSAQARGRYTFGFKRLSLLSALSSSVVLLIGSVYICSMAVERIFSPVTPELNGMLLLAVLGVAVNGFAAWKMGHGHTQNEKALSWHMIEDLLGWIAVLLGSLIMRFVEAPWIDAVLSLIIAGIVITGAMRNFWSSSQLFLQAAPNIQLEELRSELSKVSGVLQLNSFKVWSLDGAHHVASIHASLDGVKDPVARQLIKSDMRHILSHHGHFDATIEWDEA